MVPPAIACHRADPDNMAGASHAHGQGSRLAKTGGAGEVHVLAVGRVREDLEFGLGPCFVLTQRNNFIALPQVKDLLGSPGRRFSCLRANAHVSGPGQNKDLISGQRSALIKGESSPAWVQGKAKL